MSWTVDRQSFQVRDLGANAPRQGARGLAALAFAALLSGACTGVVTSPGSNQAGGSSGSNPTGGASGTGGSTAPGTLSTGGVKLRLLTQAEYLASVQSLLGPLTTQLKLPDDVSVAGYVSVGALQNSVSDGSATAYEAASLAATAEVFADNARWQKLVGCQPKADLSDACVTTYITTFGKSAFRRDLAAVEVQQWLGVAKNGAMLSGSAAQGLATATAGFLQSPNFLYRVETNKLDKTTGRLKYDGLSMANRLSYLLTGGPPSSALLDAAKAGQLDTAAGLRTAAAPLLADPAIADRLSAFFLEYSQAQFVVAVNKSTTLFPNFNMALQASMLQGTQMFIKNVVLGGSADVRAFYDSDQTFADANLAPIYGVQAPATGFAQVQLPASSGRAGILGQAAVIATQSQANRTSPTRRGVFILESLLCTTPPSPPPGVKTDLPVDPTITTRKQLEAHRAAATCASCHTLFDPMGLSMEHFDPIGRYRATENGMPIDTTGMVNGMAFDGEAQLGAVLRQDPKVMACLMRNFYRDVNGTTADVADAAQVDGMVQSLSTHGYVWRNLVADFVGSDAFRSAPALPIGSM